MGLEGTNLSGLLFSSQTIVKQYQGVSGLLTFITFQKFHDVMKEITGKETDFYKNTDFNFYR